MSSGLWGLSYDGDDYVDHGVITNWGTGAFGIECWVKKTTTGTRGFIFGNDNGANPLAVLEISAANVLHFTVRDTTGPDTAEATGTTTITGALHHVLAWRNGNNIGIFLDGVSEATGSAAALGIVTSGGKDTWGADYNGGTYRLWMVGQMYLKRIYKGTAPTQTIAQQHYNQERHLFGV